MAKRSYRCYLKLMLSFIVAVSIILGCSCWDNIASAVAVDNQLVDQIVLSFTGDSSTTSTVRFRMSAEHLSTTVKYMQKSDYHNQGNWDNALVQAAVITSTDADFKTFEATMTALVPNTEYVYCVGDNLVRSEPAYFTTAANNKTPFSLIYMGDAQTNPNDQSVGYQGWGRLLQTAATDEVKPKFIMMGGDLINNGSSSIEWGQFLAEGKNVFNTIPLMPAMGNHDNTSLYKNIFALPQNGPINEKEHFYSFDYEDAHFTVMDSNLMGAANQSDIQWLIQDLAGTDKKWKIVMFHHPAYDASNISKDAIRIKTIQDNFVPIMETYGVDLVLNGHQHTYMRTVPLKNGQPQTDGIIYLVGVSGDKPKYTLGNHSYIAQGLNNQSVYTAISFADNTVTLQSKDVAGQVLDTYSWTKGNASLPQKITLLTQDGVKINQITAPGTYKIRAKISNQLKPPSSATAMMQLRYEGATASSGGKVLSIVTANIDNLTAVEKEQDFVFTVPAGLNDQVYVDILVWDSLVAGQPLSAANQTFTFQIQS